jgi:hypothetical protein
MKKDCPTCLGIGWVCENHPQMPWSDEGGCTCGAGMPCSCNQDEDTDNVPDISEIIVEDVTIH